jgi:hypothetical protein
VSCSCTRPNRAEFDRRLVDNDEFPDANEGAIFWTARPKIGDEVLEPLSERA